MEDQLVTLCQKLTCEDWSSGQTKVSQPDTTLLHLSSSLGLTRLTCSLLHWVAEKPGTRLSREVDALSVDSEGFTPLVSLKTDDEWGAAISCLMYLILVNTEENK